MRKQSETLGFIVEVVSCLVYIAVLWWRSKERPPFDLWVSHKLMTGAYGVAETMGRVGMRAETTYREISERRYG